MTKKISNQKGELQKQLAAIQEKEWQEKLDKHHPLLKSKYEGKFFKSRNNYSCPEKASDYWWVYTKIISVERENVYESSRGLITAIVPVWSFEVDKYGNVNIRRQSTNYIHSIGTEITEDEFNRGWNKMVEVLEKLP